MASRVMPASGPVSSRSSPSRWLISVDFPVFGRPMMATRMSFASAGSASSPSSFFLRPPRSAGSAVSAGQRGAQGVIELGKPLAVLGRDRHRIAKSERIGFADAGLARRGLRTCSPPGSRACRSGAPDRRRLDRSASGRRARRSETGWHRPPRSPPRFAPACGACRLPGVDSSRPAVSIAVKARSPSRASPSRRSRVTPGRSSTSARRLPTRRLNSVDLPTFGRPTMATEKVMGRTRGLGGALYAPPDLQTQSGSRQQRDQRGAGGSGHCIPCCCGASRRRIGPLQSAAATAAAADRAIAPAALRCGHAARAAAPSRRRRLSGSTVSALASALALGFGLGLRLIRQRTCAASAPAGPAARQPDCP